MITGSYDSHTMGVLKRAFDEAWTETQKLIGSRPLTAESIRRSLAKRIMLAADKGERDPQRLKLIALQAIQG